MYVEVNRGRGSSENKWSDMIDGDIKTAGVSEDDAWDQNL